MSEYLPISELENGIKYGSKNYIELLKRKYNNIIKFNLYGIDNIQFAIFDSEYINSLLSETNKKLNNFIGIKLTKEDLMLDSYYSATIEGAKTTVNEVIKNYNNPTNESETMVVQSFKGLNRALRDGINTNNINSIWNIIIKNCCDNKNLKGNPYRKGMVYVKDGLTDEIEFTPPSEKEVPAMMEDLFRLRYNNNFTKKTDGILLGIILHYHLVYIHPFCDGNGRFARILMQQVWNSFGLSSLLKINISKGINDTRNDYYKYLKLTGEIINYQGKTYIDLSPFIFYMLRTIDESISRQSRVVSAKLNSRQKLIYDKMKKRGKGAEISVEKACKLLKLDDKNKVRKDLNDLVEKEVLFKYKEGSINIYKLL